MSSDPNDLAPLTPEHFLIGRPLLALPSNSNGAMVSYAPCWQLVQRMMGEFWARWQKEYLKQLLARSKWRGLQKNVTIGDLVLIKENNVAPMCWPMGRITKTYKGHDG